MDNQTRHFSSFIDGKRLNTEICHYNGKIEYDDFDSNVGMEVILSLNNRGSNVSGLLAVLKKHLNKNYQKLKDGNTSENIPFVDISYENGQDHLVLIGNQNAIQHTLKHLESSLKSAGGSQFHSNNPLKDVKMEIKENNVDLEEIMNKENSCEENFDKEDENKTISIEQFNLYQESYNSKILELNEKIKTLEKN